MRSTFLIYSSFSLLNLLVSYALLWLIANQLSPAQYADYGFYTAIMALALIFVNAGHKEALFKYASQKDPQQLSQLRRSSAYWMLLFLATALILLSLDRLLGLAALSFWLLHSLILANSLNRGWACYWRDAASIPLYRTLWLATLAAYWVSGNTPKTEHIFTAAALACIVVILVLSGRRVAEFYRPPWGPTRWPMQERVLWHFFWLELVTVAYMRLDMLLVRAYGLPEHEIAELFLAIQLLDAAQFMLIPLAYLYFNRLNQATAAMAHLTRQFGTLLGVLVTGLLLGWWWLGAPFLQWMFPHYAQAHGLIFLMFSCLIPMALNALLSYALFAIHQERRYVKICALALISATVLMNLLIPTLGIEGAVLARLLTECLISLGLLITVYRMRAAFKRGTAHPSSSAAKVE